MNNERRKTLTDAANRLATVVKEIGSIDFQAQIDALDSIKSDIEDVRNDEEDAFESLSGGLQQAERGQRMEEVVGELEEAINSIEDIVSNMEDTMNWVSMLDDIIGKIEKARD